MKTRLLILASMALVLAACPSPVVTPPPTNLNMSISSSSTSLPASYPFYTAANVNVSVTVTNNGRDVAPGETVTCNFVVDQRTGLGYAAAYTTSLIQTQVSTAGVANGGTLQFTFPPIDISSYGSHGANYFYVFIDTSDSSGALTDADSSDNIKQLNTAAINKTLPHDAWAAPVTRAGGAAAGSAVAISPSSWYASTVAVPNVMWYSVPVTSGVTYDIYWDDYFQGSGTMTGDMMVTAFKVDGTTAYNTPADNGYLLPLQVVPTETTLLIQVNPAGADGTFAVGIAPH